ncbi:MAG TPA: MFS transporter [Nitrospirales bacterium]|nr:MFS transporter [Nitrospirales bacterium]
MTKSDRPPRWMRCTRQSPMDALRSLASMNPSIGSSAAKRNMPIHERRENGSDLVTRREILAWCFFDFANSSFAILILTLGYSVYFVQVVAAKSDYNPEQLWSWGYACSMFMVALCAPILGATADATATKKRWLALCTALCIVSTASLFFVVPGDIWFGLVVFGLANIGFDLGFMLYSAFLVEISTRSNMGRISGYGWAFGYLGGLLSLALAYPLLKGGLGTENLVNYRLSFALTALFFVIASLPTFLYLKERAIPTPLVAERSVWSIGFQRLRRTYGEITRFKELFKYLIAYLIYTDGINTVILFAGIFASRVLEFTPSELIVYFLIVQISAGVGAYVFGGIVDRFGPRQTIMATLIIWVGIAVGAYFVQTTAQFYVLGLIAGAALGSNQSASRTLIGYFTPRDKVGEFFGFFSVSGKFAAMIGPLIYGQITAVAGSQRPAALAMAGFFLTGLAILWTVREQDGIHAATHTSTER